MIDIFYFDKKLKKGKVEDLNKLKGKQLWIDVAGITNDESHLLKEVFNIHPVTIEDLSKAQTRIKIEEFPDYLFCVFYGIHKAKSIEMVELDFIIGKNFLISSHPQKVESFENLKSNDGHLEKLFTKGNDRIFHKLLGEEMDNYIPVLQKLGEQIDSIEEDAVKKPSSGLLSRIFSLRQEINKIKKTSFVQREKIGLLTKDEFRFISKKATPYFRDIQDDAIIVSDMVDNYRESVNNAFDVYMSSLSNNTNEVMKVLSIIATIALPLTVISGIYGTNFVKLPGAAHDYGFWFMMLAMALLVSGMMYFFRRRHWF